MNAGVLEGFCRRCLCMHRLDSMAARPACQELMAILHRERRLDFEETARLADPLCSTEALFGPARGKMFGVLLCRDRRDRMVQLKGFSGQFNGRWHIEGWAGPAFSPRAFEALVNPVDCQIKSLEQSIPLLAGAERITAVARRRQLSRQLMAEIHDLYRLHNFRGECASLREAFADGGGIPNGTGDCCAPKLLNQAARLGLMPLSLSEFYWGKANRSSSRQHGRFYAACRQKCAPILGWLLCGLDGTT